MHKSDINTVDWSPLNNNLIATGSEDTLVKVLDLRRANGKDNPIVKTLHKHNSKVQGVKFCPFNSRYLASSGDSLIFWDIKDLTNHSHHEVTSKLDFDCGHFENHETKDCTCDQSIILNHIGHIGMVSDFDWNHLS